MQIFNKPNIFNFDCVVCAGIWCVRRVWPRLQSAKRSVIKYDVGTWLGFLVSARPNKPTGGRENKLTTWVSAIDSPGLQLGLFLARCPTLPRLSVWIYSRMKIRFHYRSISTTQWNMKTSNCSIQYSNALYGFELMGFNLTFYWFLRDPPCNSWYFFSYVGFPSFPAFPDQARRRWMQSLRFCFCRITRSP